MVSKSTAKVPLFTFGVGILIGRNLCLLKSSTSSIGAPTIGSTAAHASPSQSHLPDIPESRQTTDLPVEVRCNYHAPANATCEGIFEYSPPNTNVTNAQEILRDEASKYRYGGDDRDLIFFPEGFSTPEECIQQWKDNQIKYKDNGMSSWKEDTIIYETFFSSDQRFKTNGFYMEIGAHNGVRESNSRFFDVCLNWKGLLVEANSRNYLRMAKLRPTAHHLCVAPSCKEPSVVSFPLHLFTQGRQNEEGNLLDIHCEPLSWSLEQLGIRHVDFWSLDVEGVERLVLETVDFDSVQIDVIMAESDNRLADKDTSAEEVRRFLKGKGYLLLDQSIAVYKSDVFLHQKACSKYKFPECHGQKSE
ncbi:hypothetical protein THAOC_03581 [Thalassiosira oceanica]|uniref:Methyltransferase FkbM domain-containing protein n=1 Tax=Thalassiosira oceanica TaxID=159749 RepID=K0T7K9_THAOC|nr:hypothetical protein THAOC_03581 [Thalassiosira oceanica]|mmetsp:Transcript_32996/g.78789  ORF Transcript_32996/g.78789 Transcript_32996/m.78789 type:complete len:361 (+) Transcript_32996:168-1250(+)|eukprot:EJK74728.1 hypothetical protein THAOC_03581 [Thalassiosira oceanica]